MILVPQSLLSNMIVNVITFQTSAVEFCVATIDTRRKIEECLVIVTVQYNVDWLETFIILYSRFV